MDEENCANSALTEVVADLDQDAASPSVEPSSKLLHTSEIKMDEENCANSDPPEVVVNSDRDAASPSVEPSSKVLRTSEIKMDEENCANGVSPEVVVDADQDAASPSIKPNSKLSEAQWQETLISLVAAQQQQIAELAKQTKMATMSSSPSLPTLNRSVADRSGTKTPALGSGDITFKLTTYDPDNSDYTVHEWIEEATKLKEELNVSDNVMIAKARQALKKRGTQYCREWKPIRRTWENFCADLITAFPDTETPGARAFVAATLRSRDCDSLCDYGNQKLRSIYRFYEKLPWDKILSMVVYGLDHLAARAALHAKLPQSDKEVIAILREFDALRVAKRPLDAENTQRKKIVWKNREICQVPPKLYYAATVGRKVTVKYNVGIL